MPRPASKDQLITAANDNFAAIWQLIDTLSVPAEQVFFAFPENPTFAKAHWQRDKNIRDVLIHLYEWHQLFISWATNNHKGNHTPFLPAPFTFKTTPALNVEFWHKHQMTRYAQAVGLLTTSHGDVMDIIEQFTDHQLFTKKYFSWTGSTSLGSYAVSATSSHYDWALKKIKKYQRMARKQR